MPADFRSSDYTEREREFNCLGLKLDTRLNSDYLHMEILSHCFEC